MKLLFAVIATIAVTQVDWVEGQGMNASAIEECTCEKIVLRAGGTSFTGIWDRLRDPVNGLPAYKMQNNFEDLILSWNNEWITTTNIPFLFSALNDKPLCPETLDEGWKYQMFGTPASDRGDWTARCLNCTKNPEDCPRDYESMRLRVSNFIPPMDGFPISSAEVNGFYDRVIGETRDDRFVFKNPQSGIWFYSYSFRWIFSDSFTEDHLETIYTNEPAMIYDAIMNVTEIRSSDCSDVSTIQDECDPDCVQCKKVLEGPMRGNYFLAAQNDSRCVDGCVYGRDGNNYCFIPGGPLVQQGCGL